VWSRRKRSERIIPEGKIEEMADCYGVLSVKGEHFQCDMDAPHQGLAHSNKKAEAIWCSDEEARISQGLGPRVSQRRRWWQRKK
jgi:hypothetical protein